MKVELDPPLLWRLSDLAEARGTDVSGVIRELLVGGNVPVPGERVYLTADGEQTRAEVARLVGLGWTDAQIAVEVGRVQPHVAGVRRGLGLKANRGKRGVV